MKYKQGLAVSCVFIATLCAHDLDDIARSLPLPSESASTIEPTSQETSYSPCGKEVVLENDASSTEVSELHQTASYPSLIFSSAHSKKISLPAACKLYIPEALYTLYISEESKEIPPSTESFLLNTCDSLPVALSARSSKTSEVVLKKSEKEELFLSRITREMQKQKMTAALQEMSVDSFQLEKVTQESRNAQPEERSLTLLGTNDPSLVVLAPEVSDSIFEFGRDPLFISPLPKSIVPDQKSEPVLDVSIPTLPPIELFSKQKVFSPQAQEQTPAMHDEGEYALEATWAKEPIDPNFSEEKCEVDLAKHPSSHEKHLKNDHSLSLPSKQLRIHKKRIELLPLDTARVPYRHNVQQKPLTQTAPKLSPHTSPTLPAQFGLPHFVPYLADTKRERTQTPLPKWHSSINVDTPQIEALAMQDSKSALPSGENDPLVLQNKAQITLSTQSPHSKESLAIDKNGPQIASKDLENRPKHSLDTHQSKGLVENALAFEPQIHSPMPRSPDRETKGELTHSSSLPEVALPEVERKENGLVPEEITPAKIKEEPLVPSRKRWGRKNKQIRNSSSAADSLPSFIGVDSIPFHNEFTPDVCVGPQEDGNGYYFSITLRPQPHVIFTPTPQHIIFIVDKSQSIKRHRFDVYRQGVLKSLSYLKEGDRFNIFTADAKMRELSPEPLPVTPDTIRRAKEFLHKEYFSGYFDSYSPIALFDKVYEYAEKIPSTNVVWLTDGKGLKTINKNRNLLRSLKSRSRGHFTLYAATASEDNNLAMLDLISKVKQGELLHTQTHASFPRQLAVLTKKISKTVATDVTLGARHTTGHVELYTLGGQPPHLNLHTPYVIYGRAETLDDFELIMRGTVADQELDIKQTISFNNAKPLPHKTRKAIASFQAYMFYEAFLREGKEIYLKEAKSRVARFGTPVPCK